MTNLDHPHETHSETPGYGGQRLRQPFFTPLDVAAFVVTVAMIWGPLAAGVLRLR